MPRKKEVKKSEKEAMRDSLKVLFPNAVILMDKVLNDDLKDRAGRRVKTTVSQRLAIAHEVVQQTLGRAPQGTTLGIETTKVPITTLEVVKQVERLLPEVSRNLVSIDAPLVAPNTRETWLEEIEKEALEVE